MLLHWLKLCCIKEALRPRQAGPHAAQGRPGKQVAGAAGTGCKPWSPGQPVWGSVGLVFATLRRSQRLYRLLRCQQQQLQVLAVHPQQLISFQTCHRAVVQRRPRATPSRTLQQLCCRRPHCPRLKLRCAVVQGRHGEQPAGGCGDGVPGQVRLHFHRAQSTCSSELVWHAVAWQPVGGGGVRVGGRVRASRWAKIAMHGTCGAQPRSSLPCMYSRCNCRRSGAHAA